MLNETRKWIFAISAFILIVTILTIALLFNPAINKANIVDTDPAFKTFTDHYLSIMKNLNSSATRSQMALQLNPNYNQTDLFTWQQSKMIFAQDPTGFYEDRFQILASGKGICVQWSIVYVSACLALGYQSRLVVAVDISSWSFIHTWAEDYYNGTWVHVDPSDKVWNNPLRYQSWSWGSAIGSQVKIFAFEDGTYKDVTATYSSH
ncbi:MAG TPA: transglutaminase-like domain-containing protein [Candidatus Acidoferrum sp.]|nr:transglutaminase-like domain-containing protein [Candidatus Acidoferrum sp.]